MNRMAISIPEPLQQRLRLTSQQEGKNVSALMRELVEKGLNRREQARLDHTYKALSQLDGMGDPAIIDASVTIDETLYGENGVWKGSERINKRK